MVSLQILEITNLENDENLEENSEQAYELN